MEVDIRKQKGRASEKSPNAFSDGPGLNTFSFAVCLKILRKQGMERLHLIAAVTVYLFPCFVQIMLDYLIPGWQQQEILRLDLKRSL